MCSRPKWCAITGHDMRIAEEIAKQYSLREHQLLKISPQPRVRTLKISLASIHEGAATSSLFNVRIFACVENASEIPNSSFASDVDSMLPPRLRSLASRQWDACSDGFMYFAHSEDESFSGRKVKEGAEDISRKQIRERIVTSR